MNNITDTFSFTSIADIVTGDLDPQSPEAFELMYFLQGGDLGRSESRREVRALRENHSKATELCCACAAELVSQFPQLNELVQARELLRGYCGSSEISHFEATLDCVGLGLCGNPDLGCEDDAENQLCWGNGRPNFDNLLVDVRRPERPAIIPMAAMKDEFDA